MRITDATQTCLKPIEVENPGDTVKPSSTGKGMLRCGVSRTRTPASWLMLGMYSSWFTNKSSVRPDRRKKLKGSVGQSVLNLLCGRLLNWICTNLLISSSTLTMREIITVITIFLSGLCAGENRSLFTILVGTRIKCITVSVSPVPCRLPVLKEIAVCQENKTIGEDKKLLGR